MGYSFNKSKELSFHHLIAPHNICKSIGLGEGYLKKNGVILKQNTSHNYIHVIENIDLDRFFAIISELLDENIKGYIDIENLTKIDDILSSFEREYCALKDNKGNFIIKNEYTIRQIKRKY